MSIPTKYETYKASVEWYTPREYIEAARRVMGSIALDPASSDEAQKVVQAEQYYTLKADGFNRAWYGPLWLNPPYGKTGNLSHQQLWTSKLIAAYQAGDVAEAVCLTSSTDTSTKWYHRLLTYPHCITDHRIQFKKFVEGNYVHGDRAMGGSMFTYFGKNTEAFYHEFSVFGPCFLPAFRYEKNLQMSLDFS